MRLTRKICVTDEFLKTEIFIFFAGNGSGDQEVVLIYSRFCPGGVEWAKYLNKLFTELSKHKGKMR